MKFLFGSKWRCCKYSQSVFLICSPHLLYFSLIICVFTGRKSSKFLVTLFLDSYILTTCTSFLLLKWPVDWLHVEVSFKTIFYLTLPQVRESLGRGVGVVSIVQEDALPFYPSEAVAETQLSFSALQKCKGGSVASNACPKNGDAIAVQRRSDSCMCSSLLSIPLPVCSLALGKQQANIKNTHIVPRKEQKKVYKYLLYVYSVMPSLSTKSSLSKHSNLPALFPSQVLQLAGRTTDIIWGNKTKRHVTSL